MATDLRNSFSSTQVRDCVDPEVGNHHVAPCLRKRSGYAFEAPGQVCMTVWWLSDPQRLSAERVAIQAIDEDWFENAAWSLDGQLRLRLVFDIVLPRGRYRLAMVYHNTFPASPPSVRPVDGEERLSLHQYGRGGDLCLSIRKRQLDPGRDWV